MFDTIEARVVVLRQPPRKTDAAAEQQALRRRCLHPADAWAMKRRAGRPETPSRRLPAVARVG